MIKTIGLTVLASCALLATPAHAQSTAPASTLEIKVRGNASVSQEAENGTLFVNGMISSDFDWDAFEYELMEQTSVTRSEHENGWVMYPPISNPEMTQERTYIVRLFEGSASEVLAADGYITASGLDIFTVFSLNMDPTPETERRAVEMATADAREQAELVALSTGCSLDRLSSIELLTLEPNGRMDTPTLSLVSQDNAAQRSSQPSSTAPEALLEASLSATFIAQCP
ncbi:SIMPL domain-containing protein [Oceanicaulis sp.]|uniref:SIMPL domain-containing protein n=1 Tax=Oceanicaulis sp. TaxID=1924941 RepID=UPI003D2C0C6A